MTDRLIGAACEVKPSGLGGLATIAPPLAIGLGTVMWTLAPGLPPGLWAAVLALAPPLALAVMIVASRSGGVVAPRDWRWTALTWLMIQASVALALRTAAEVHLMTLAASAVAGVALGLALAAGGLAVRWPPGGGDARARWLTVAAPLALWGWGSLTQADVLFDRAAPSFYPTIVRAERVVQGRPDRFFMELGPWGPLGRGVGDMGGLDRMEVQVDHALYALGPPLICMRVGQGALGWRWWSPQECPHALLPKQPPAWNPSDEEIADVEQAVRPGADPGRYERYYAGDHNGPQRLIVGVWILAPPTARGAPRPAHVVALKDLPAPTGAGCRSMLIRYDADATRLLRAACPSVRQADGW